MSALVEMKGVVKKFPGVTALKDITFDIQPGEVHVLLGENGAGKSTLMKILSGVYQPTEGEIIVGGKSYKRLTPKRFRRKWHQRNLPRTERHKRTFNSGKPFCR